MSRLCTLLLILQALFPFILIAQNKNAIPPNEDYSKIYGAVSKIETYRYSAVMEGGEFDKAKTLMVSPLEFREYDYDFKRRLIKDALYNNQYQLVHYFQYIYDSEDLRYHILRNYYGTDTFRVEYSDDSFRLLYSLDNVEGNDLPNEEYMKYSYQNGMLKEIRSPNKTVVLDYFADGYIVTFSQFYEDTLYKVITQRFDKNGHLIDETTNVNDRRLLTKYSKYVYDSVGNWVSRLYKTIFDDKEVYYYEFRRITYL